MDFLEKAKQLKSVLNRLHTAKLAHKAANKIYNESKVWRYDADPEAHHWQLKSYERLEAATADLKSAEAELRRIKLARVFN